jgi:transcriptional regulator with XRE-family HTH domain
MATLSSPTVWRRWLAMELRRLRDEEGLAQKDASKACGWSGARLSYIENAQQNVTREDLDQLLPLYHVPEKERADYYEATRRSQEKGWWERYQRLVPPGVQLFAAFEQGASSIRAFHPVVLPGLLQTPAYAAQVFEAEVWPRTEQQIARLVEVRQERQKILTRDQQPLELKVVIDEATLRHRTDHDATMAEQLDHVIAIAELPNVTLQVLPFERGVQSYSLGEFQIFDFPWEADPGVVCLELREQTVYLEEVHEIDSYALAFEHLSDHALSPEQSIATVRATSKEYRRRE